MRFFSGDAPAALRAGVSVATPLLVVLLIDRPHWAMYAARTWLAVLIAAVIGGAGTALATLAEWHPPGALFLVFAFGAVASVPHRLADLPAAVAVASASAAFSLLVANAPALARAPVGGGPRAAPSADREFRPLDVRTKLRHTMPAAVSTAASALVAGTVATGFGIGHPYWATVAAVAPLSARGRSAQLVRAAHRIAGTLGGLLLAAVILAPGFGPYPAVAILAVLQVAAELVVARNYGVAMLFITPLALLMNQVAAPRPTVLTRASL